MRLCATDAAPPDPVVNVYLLRGGERLQSPHRVTYRMFEWSQMRGRWIYPDVGYWDSGYGQDQLWFAGGGADLILRKNFTWEQEIYFAQEAGPDAHNQRSLWLWTVLDFKLQHGLSAQFVPYPTLPLNHSQGWGFDVDRAKVEKALGDHWLAGIGSSGGVCEGGTWKTRPFGTISRKTGEGKFEFWLQKIPGGGQVQFRYLLVTRNKN